MWQKVDGLQPVTTSSVVGMRRNSIAAPKAKLEQNKQRNEGTATITVWWSAVSLIYTTAIWVPVKSLCLRSVLHTSMRYRKTTAQQLALVYRKGPIVLLGNINQYLKSWVNGAIEFALTAIFIWSLLLPQAPQLFSGKRFSKQARCRFWRKCFSSVLNPFKARTYGFLCYWDKEICFLLAKMCWLW